MEAVALKEEAIEEAEKTGKKLPKNTSGEIIVKQSDEQLIEIKEEIKASLGEFVAEESIKAANKVNELREARGIPPIQVDIEKTKAA